MTPVALPELPDMEVFLPIARLTGKPQVWLTQKDALEMALRAVLAERAAERARCAAICENNEVLNGVHGGQRIRPNSTESGKHDGTAYAAAIRNQD